MSDKTATERLRELLDERGIGWGIADYSRRRLMTVWHVDGQKWQFFEDRKTGWTHLSCRMDYLTPEQAIEATLDSSNCTNSERTETCKPVAYDNGSAECQVDPGDYYEFWEPACACSECGELIPMRKFCPNCGRRLEVDG